MDAIVLQPTSVKTYADVLSKIRSSVDPETAGVEVRSIRRTKTGQVLLKLKKSSTESRTTFTEKLKSVVGSEITMRVLVPRSVLEIRDLDECITAAEVESSLKRDLLDYKGFLQISTTKPNDRGQRMAIVTVEESAAALVMSKARIKIGWVNFRIRSRLTVLRCFMCPGYGHQSMACKGPIAVSYASGAEKATSKSKTVLKSHDAFCTQNSRTHLIRGITWRDRNMRRL